MITIEKIEQTLKNLNTPKNKKIIYRTLIVLAVLLVGYRFYSVAKESNFKVFNIIRNNMKNGTPVEILKMEKRNFQKVKNKKGSLHTQKLSLKKMEKLIGICLWK